MAWQPQGSQEGGWEQKQHTPPLPGDQDTCKEGVRDLGPCSVQSSHVTLEWLASVSTRYQGPLHNGRAGSFSRRPSGLPDPQGSHIHPLGG